MQHALIDDVDDVAFGARGKLRGEIAREEGRGFGMDREMGIPELFIKIGDAVGLVDRGVVDEDGQRAEGLCGLGDEAGALAAVGEVGLDERGLAAGALMSATTAFAPSAELR